MDTNATEQTTTTAQGGPAAAPGAGGDAALAAELQERLLRMAADFDNFKKRAARERDETRRSATESIIARLLPVLDNFEMAMAAASQPAASLDTLRDGVQMIQSQLRSAFSDTGLEEVPAVGKLFDPSIHEAVSQRETADVPEGQVVQQLRKGYRIRERLLRPASVVVARTPSPANS
jgi:molecular chaperone GrpE